MKVSIRACTSCCARLRSRALATRPRERVSRFVYRNPPPGSHSVA